MAIMFTACIACEFIKDDMKLLYQGVILLVNGAIGLVVGWSLFGDNILYGRPRLATIRSDGSSARSEHCAASYYSSSGCPAP
jgi:hypothetical protein